MQAASDGGLVVFHDLRLDRLTPASGPLRARPLAELRELGIPTLEEVLELTAGRIGVMAELKSPWLFRRHDIVGRTVRLLGPAAVVVSFSRRAILETRRLRPSLRTVQHVGYGTSIRAAAAFAWAAGFDDSRGDAPRGRQSARARAAGPRLHGQRAVTPARAAGERRRRRVHRPSGSGTGNTGWSARLSRRGLSGGKLATTFVPTDERRRLAPSRGPR